jgi:hypothetical protein
MTSANTTGPLAFGRWQQPAAAIQAGLLPPDPYPLENILFCATCGQQFFGAHEPSATQEGGVRVYRTFCGHRPGPLPADEVELRIYAETHVLAFGTDAVTGLSNAHYALLAIRFFSRVELGSTSDEITFSNRI